MHFCGGFGEKLQLPGIVNINPPSVWEKTFISTALLLWIRPGALGGELERRATWAAFLFLQRQVRFLGWVFFYFTPMDKTSPTLTVLLPRTLERKFASAFSNCKKQWIDAVQHPAVDWFIDLNRPLDEVKGNFYLQLLNVTVWLQY